MSTKSSSKYPAKNSFQPSPHSTYAPELESTHIDELRNDYSKALTYIEALKIEKNNLKDALDLALCDTDAYYNSHRRDFTLSGNATPNNASARMLELEQENQDLKLLLETNSKRIVQLQNENQEYLARFQELESIHHHNNELKMELSCLNKQFISVSTKLIETEKRYSTLASSQAAYQNRESSNSEKHSIIKYGKYIRKLVDSADRHHFTYCCFEERFSKNTEFLSLVQSTDCVSLLLKAFKYITDLLININSYHYTNPIPYPGTRAYPVSAGMPARPEYPMQIDDDISFVTDYLPDQNAGISRGETPVQNTRVSPFETPTRPRHSPELLTRPVNNDEYMTLGDTRPRQNSGNKSSSKKSGSAVKKGTNDREGRDNSTIRKADREGRDNSASKGVARGEAERAKNVANSTVGRTAAVEEQKLINRFKELRDKCKELKGEEMASRRETEERGSEQGFEQGESVRKQNNGGKQSPFNNEKLAKELSGITRKLSGNTRGNVMQPGQEQRDLSGMRDQSRDESFNSRRLSSQGNREMMQSGGKKGSRGHESARKEGAGSGYKVSSRLRSPAEDYHGPNSARPSYSNTDEHMSGYLSSRMSRKVDYNGGHMGLGTDYPSFKVSFWKTESRGRSGSPSPPPKVGSILDVARKKRVDEYHKQSYDMIKGQELVRKSYIDQHGIVESKVVSKGNEKKQCTMCNIKNDVCC